MNEKTLVGRIIIIIIIITPLDGPPQPELSSALHKTNNKK